MEIIEEVSSQGIWTWLEFDNNSNSIYLEFENLKLADFSIDNTVKDNGDLVIRFGNNIFCSVFYDDIENFDFLNINKQIFDKLFYSNYKLTDLDNSYFFTEFSKKISKLKFQDYDLLKEIINKYGNRKDLIQNSIQLDTDFILVLECDNIAIAVGGNFVNTFNDSESLNSDDIKRLSNKWILYYLDYWDKKGTENAYNKDLLCEEIPFIKYK